MGLWIKAKNIKNNGQFIDKEHKKIDELKHFMLLKKFAVILRFSFIQ